MLTVYHFLLDHRIGGPHVYVDTLRHALAGQVRAVVLTSGKGPMTEHALLNLRHLWWPLYVLEVVCNVVLIIALAWRQRIRAESAIFHVHGGGNVAPLIAARLLGLPVVWHLHETTTSFRRLVWVGQRLLVGVHHQVATVARKAIDVYGLSRAVLLPGAVDLQYWSTSQVTQSQRDGASWAETFETNRSNRQMRVLAVGNLNPLKGHDVLLTALQSYEGSFHLKIVGAELSTHAKYADQLRQLSRSAEATGPSRSVEFLGWRSKAAVRALLATCDVFVMPSRSEACPLVLLEALAMGCVCIASDVGDVRAMSSASSQARVVAPESVDALLDALTNVAASVVMPRTHSGSQPSLVPPQWQLAQLTRETLRIYRELLPDHGH